nr:MAG TPA: hypothetical protein [Caudoviricetes sp.]
MASIPSSATVKGAIQWAIDPTSGGIVAVAPVTLYEHVMGAPKIVTNQATAGTDSNNAPFVLLKTGTATIG